MIRTRAALSLLIPFIISAATLGRHQITRPEDLAGRWEAPDGFGGVVGMQILVSTTVPSTLKDLRGVPQTIERLQIGLFQRGGGDVLPLGFNFFLTNPYKGATWDGHRLKIDLQRTSQLPEIHVDLLWNPAVHTWFGSFQRAGILNRATTLRRPASSRNSPFDGTWLTGGGAELQCLHIAQAQDATFLGWLDTIRIPGLERYANGLQPPPLVMETYGDFARINVIPPRRLRVELAPYAAGCCSLGFTAVLSPDGTYLEVQSTASPNPTPLPIRWIRIRGDSCITPAPHPR